MATIAIPAFGDQRSRAKDARAKQIAHNAYIAMESCAAGSWTGYDLCDDDALRAIDPTLPERPTFKVNGLSADKFTIVVQSEPSSQKFRIRLNARGIVSFPCGNRGVGGCPADGNWD